MRDKTPNGKPAHGCPILARPICNCMSKPEFRELDTYIAIVLQVWFVEKPHFQQAGLHVDKYFRLLEFHAVN